MPITWLDFILFTFMFLSGFLAMVRGFSREIITMLSWSISMLGSFFLFPFLQGYAYKMGLSGWLTDVIVAGTIFVIIFLISTIMFARLVKYCLDSTIGILDRSFGFIFGAIRGLLIVGAANMLFVGLVAERNRPIWVTQALSGPLLNNTSDAISWTLSSISAVGIRSTSNYVASLPEPDKVEENGEFIDYLKYDRNGLSQLFQSDTEIRKE